MRASLLSCQLHCCKGDDEVRVAYRTASHATEFNKYVVAGVYDVIRVVQVTKDRIGNGTSDYEAVASHLRQIFGDAKRSAMARYIQAEPLYHSFPHP